MGENNGNMVRVRLVFDDHHLLDESQRSQGLSSCWFPLKGITNFGDLASQIRKSFGFRHRIVLYMDDFVLPTFESTCTIRVKDIIRIKRKDAKKKNICNPCDLQDSENAMLHDMDLNKNLLANGSYVKEILTSCMQNSIHIDPPGDAGLIKRKEKHSKIKRKDAKKKNICNPCDLQDSENAMVHAMDLNKNLLANGSYVKEILTSCMQNSIHIDPPGDAGLIKQKRKHSKGQYYEFSHGNELEPINNSDARKKKRASPQMLPHSSDGEEGLVAPAGVSSAPTSNHPLFFHQVSTNQHTLFYQGKSALLFSEEKYVLAMPFAFTLIGKFLTGRPSMEIIQRFFAHLQLMNNYSIGLVDSRHVIIKLSGEADYIRLFLRRSYHTRDFSMRVLKWSADFDCSVEPPITPIWISFPYLRLQYFNRSILFSLASIFGKPLQIDAKTARFSKPSVARVLVELDVTAPLHKEVWIGSLSSGYWQKVEFESIPVYCSSCHSFGHEFPNCFKAHPELHDPKS